MKIFNVLFALMLTASFVSQAAWKNHDPRRQERLDRLRAESDKRKIQAGEFQEVLKRHTELQAEEKANINNNIKALGHIAHAAGHTTRKIGKKHLAEQEKGTLLTPEQQEERKKILSDGLKKA